MTAGSPLQVVRVELTRVSESTRLTYCVQYMTRLRRSRATGCGCETPTPVRVWAGHPRAPKLAAMSGLLADNPATRGTVRAAAAGSGVTATVTGAYLLGAFTSPQASAEITMKAHAALLLSAGLVILIGPRRLRTPAAALAAAASLALLAVGLMAAFQGLGSGLLLASGLGLVAALIHLFTRRTFGAQRRTASVLPWALIWLVVQTTGLVMLVVGAGGITVFTLDPALTVGILAPAVAVGAALTAAAFVPGRKAALAVLLPAMLVLGASIGSAPEILAGDTSNGALGQALTVLGWLAAGCTVIAALRPPDTAAEFDERPAAVIIAEALAALEEDADGPAPVPTPALIRGTGIGPDGPRGSTASQPSAGPVLRIVR